MVFNASQTLNFMLFSPTSSHRKDEICLDIEWPVDRGFLLFRCLDDFGEFKS